jgi:hypothetical protein
MPRHIGGERDALSGGEKLVFGSPWGKFGVTFAIAERSLSPVELISTKVLFSGSIIAKGVARKC